MVAKSRFTSVDVRAMVRDLRASILGERVANIFDVDDKTYLFKFSVKDDETGESDKVILLIESGIRFHTTKFQRQKSEFPSPFAMKLRKHLRTKKLEDIQQVGLDRVVDIRFGSGESACHVFLEFYSNGNLVLTDSNYVVLALLRSHQFEADVALKVGELYPLKFSTNIADTGPAAADDVGIQCGNVGQFLAWATQRNEMQDLWQQSQHAAGAKGGKTKKMNLRQLLLSKDSTVSHFGPEILDHIVLSCPGLSPSTKVSSLLSSCEADAVGAAALLQGLRGAEALLKDLDQPHQPGYIIAKSAEPGAELLEFTSALLKQHEGQASKVFAAYGDAVDEYFFKLEDAKIRKLQNAAEEAALKKLQKVKSEAENHAKKLVQTQESMQRAAQVVTAHAEEIDKCTLVLNSCLESGMAWQDIEAMVALEARQGNPIATLIKRLRLDKNRVVLELPAPREEDEDDEADPEAEAEEDRFEDDGGAAGGSRLRAARISGVPGIDVEINLALSAHANARTLFSHKKAVSQKHAQTLESSSRAVAAVEQSTHKTIEAQKQKQTLKEARKVHWFERFHWFVSSDGHLVLSGKDAQQNDLLVKRYLRKHDVYVHAEVHGAASCVIRCKDLSPEAIEAGVLSSVTPSALHEAAQACVCRSHAWGAKQIASAFWVYSHQVSKSAPSGEYLTTGSFIITGRRNFLPPLSLEMGFGVMFRLDDQSVARHKRQSKAPFEDDTTSYLSLHDRYGLEDAAEQRQGVGEEEDDDEPSEGDGGSCCKEEDIDPAPDFASLSGSAAGMTGEKDAGLSDREEEDEQECEGEKEEEEEEEQETDEEELRAPLPPPPKKSGGKQSGPPAPAPETKSKRSKALSKKKARKYADQDDEDRALSLLALGHKPPAGQKMATEAAAAASASAKDEARRERLGVSLLIGATSNAWVEAFAALPPAVSQALSALHSASPPLLREGDVGADELRALAAFNEAAGLDVLALFSGVDGANLIKGGNKSAFLSGVMRRYAKEHAGSGAGAGAGAGAKHQKPKPKLKAAAVEASILEQKEVDAIMEEEGILDEEEGRAADDHDKLSGSLLPDDVFMYAVPVVGPYTALRNFKYKVKLTPGTLKKGKARQTAIEGWTRSKDVSEKEKGLIRGLGDAECVAVLLGDVRVSMPGLHGSGTAKDAKRKAQRGQKKD